MEQARKTAYQWLMAKATGRDKFFNAFEGKMDHVSGWVFFECSNSTVEDWLEDATQVILEAYGEK
jgi:hypothetical protein